MKGNLWSNFFLLEEILKVFNVIVESSKEYNLEASVAVVHMYQTQGPHTKFVNILSGPKELVSLFITVFNSTTIPKVRTLNILSLSYIQMNAG